MEQLTTSTGAPAGRARITLGLEQRLKQVGQQLRDALLAVTDQVAVKSRSPQELARALKVHRTLASRLLMAIRTHDPLASVSRLPRSEGLRMFLGAAHGRVPRAAVEAAEAALGEFERVVQGELGGWDGLDAAITEWLPDAREKFELANRQLAFKGLSSLAGVRSDVQLITSIYYPDASGRACDIAILEGLVGLRRLRPSARVPFAVMVPNPRAPKPLRYVVEGITQHEPGADYPLLEEFCSQPVPGFEIAQVGELTNYFVAGRDIGADAAIDIFAASVVRGGRPLFRAPEDPPRRPSGSAGANLPTRTLLLNVLLHEDVWPTSGVELRVYDTHVHGLADPNDPARDLDRLDPLETVQSLGRGAARFRASEVGRHVEMVQHVCEQLGWDSERLRGYRLRVQYPLLHAQYCVLFDAPPVRA